MIVGELWVCLMQEVDSVTRSWPTVNPAVKKNEVNFDSIQYKRVDIVTTRRQWRSEDVTSYPWQSRETCGTACTGSHFHFCLFHAGFEVFWFETCALNKSPSAK